MEQSGRQSHRSPWSMSTSQRGLGNRQCGSLELSSLHAACKGVRTWTTLLCVARGIFGCCWGALCRAASVLVMLGLLSGASELPDALSPCCLHQPARFPLR